MAISSVAFAVCTASDLTSEATTANPRPASPARAASMVALSASRLVCSAMARMSLTTSPIFCALSESPAISSVGRLCLVGRKLHHAAHSHQLVADVGDRARQLVGRVRGGLDVGRGLVEGAHRVRGALRGLLRAAEQRGGGAAHRARIAADASDEAFHLRAKRGDGGVHHGAALFLIADGGTLLRDLQPFADVLVRGHPAAARPRLVVDRDLAPVG